MPIVIKPGTATPMGATTRNDGVNFALFLQHQLPLKLVIEDAKTLTTIVSIPLQNSTGNIFHVWVGGLPSTFIYSYQLEDFVLLDPFATCLATPHTWGSKSPYHPKAYFSESHPFDWGNDTRPNIKMKDLILYEMHIRGYTQDPSSQVSHPGTYLGVIEKVDHLKDLGINAVELMPVSEFNPYEYPLPNSPYFGKIKQYWGYSPVSYFAPMSRFASGKGHLAPINEFKQMVRALHEAGIEVILDVVFNHTAEGNQKGPLFNFKKLGNETYYILNHEGDYANYTGCGNTLRCNSPVFAELILSALRYWVTEMHVDGFRFDLASIFYRGEHGTVLPTPPILDFIAEDPLLSGVKLIAEPWDAGGLYQVGSFYPKNRFSEWNASFRDCSRRFINDQGGHKGDFATRLSGSQDLYWKASPQKSINFVTCHDGFTLHDLVSYNRKHNLANGEDNRDGTTHNDSWNCGAEGATQDPAILALRLRQMCNFHLALMVSQGIPMLLMGDEYGHTKLGNNNTWCQDNTLNWFRWDLLSENKAFYDFYKGLIQFRNKTPILKHKKFLTEKTIRWHGKIPSHPLWGTEDQFIAFELLDEKGKEHLFIAFNASKEPVKVQFPKNHWKWIANTATPLTESFLDSPIEVEKEFYIMEPHSSLLLEGAYK